jgi:peptide/nickel transport system substrate-binding protein
MSTAYTSDAIDKAISDAMAATDQKDSIALLQKADKLLLQSKSAMPYFQAPNVFAYEADIANLRDNTSLNTGPTYNIAQWGIRAE